MVFANETGFISMMSGLMLGSWSKRRDATTRRRWNGMLPLTYDTVIDKEQRIIRV